MRAILTSGDIWTDAFDSVARINGEPVVVEVVIQLFELAGASMRAELLTKRDFYPVLPECLRGDMDFPHPDLLA